ncbi:hypothetical protein [Microcoleus sp. A006_D1]|uniref:hypothetical protein n=1 Tax=Microcoleus sp. A006_D1 TaxID=3055267 RepID=UPI002FD40C08
MVQSYRPPKTEAECHRGFNAGTVTGGTCLVLKHLPIAKGDKSVTPKSGRLSSDDRLERSPAPCTKSQKQTRKCQLSVMMEEFYKPLSFFRIYS